MRCPALGAACPGLAERHMKVSDLLVKCLEEEGIEYIFGVPGEENADFMISLKASSSIRFVLTRHEQGAAFMPKSTAG
jgi:acetolactate synthase-1/2/3 large subunit